MHGSVAVILKPLLLHVPEIIQLFMEKRVNVYPLLSRVRQIKNQITLIYQIPVSLGPQHIILWKRPAFRLGSKDPVILWITLLHFDNNPHFQRKISVFPPKTVDNPADNVEKCF